MTIGYITDGFQPTAPSLILAKPLADYTSQWSLRLSLEAFFGRRMRLFIIKESAMIS